MKGQVMTLAETETDTEVEEAEVEQELEADPGKSGEAEGEARPEADEGVVVTIGEESPPQEEEPAPEWVRELRKKHQETTRKLRERDEEIARLRTPAAKPALGAKPTLEGCDFDASVFERELESWHEKKREQDAEDRKKQEAIDNERKAWQAKLDNFGKLKGELKVQDFDDAEELAKETFSVTQQGVILSGAENPALLVYALGKNPKKAKELASITDPVKFAFAVAKLETQVKASPRRTAPAPEETIRGSAPVSGVVDSQLERLRAEAMQTGDSSKVLAYKRAQKAKAEKRS